MQEIRIGVENSKNSLLPVATYIFEQLDGKLSSDIYNQLESEAYSKLHSIIIDPANTQLDIYGNGPIYAIISIINASKKLGIKTIYICNLDKNDGVYKLQNIL